MRVGKNTFTIFAALLVVLVLFCMMRSEGFAVAGNMQTTPGGGFRVLRTQGGIVTQL